MYARNNTGLYIIQMFNTPEKYAFLRKALESGIRGIREEMVRKAGYLQIKNLEMLNKTRRQEKKKKKDDAKSIAKS